jgi:23S rRNA (uracil1939-C5)-methyltransferase
MALTLKRGERVTLPVVDVAFGGDGVGRVGEQVIFVPFAMDGDEARVEITEVRPRFARARLVSILSPSPRRVAAPCPSFGRCGGCRLQHVAYEHQLALKTRQVKETFARIAGLSALPLLPILPSPRPFAYRIKADFHLAGGRGAPRRTGLMALGSHDLVEVERCAIVEASINEKYGRLREELRRGKVRVRGERLTLWSDEPGEPPTEIPSGTGRPPDVTRNVGGRLLTVAQGGFFQANRSLTGALVAQVVQLSGLTGKETVLDAYGGAGLFSLFLGPLAARLFGIEGDREAVRCAGINLRRARLTQACFYQGDVGQVIERELLARQVKADVVLLDPPRDGCGEKTLTAVAALGPERIVYVSCNPATQARDCALLAGAGYRLRTLVPLDMFPQTAHIETVALLTRQEP